MLNSCLNVLTVEGDKVLVVICLYNKLIIVFLNKGKIGIKNYNLLCSVHFTNNGMET